MTNSDECPNGFCASCNPEVYTTPSPVGSSPNPSSQKPSTGPSFSPNKSRLERAADTITLWIGRDAGLTQVQQLAVIAMVQANIIQRLAATQAVGYAGGI